MEIHWNKLKTLRTTADRVGRGIAVLALVSLSFGPLATPTQAGVEPLEWDDLRPPRTDINVTDTSAAGYTYLANFGDNTIVNAAAATLFHALAVAPNGDLFTAGKAATGTASVVYKSSDGGLTWEDSAAFGCGGAMIVDLKVSPKYPSDNVVYAALTDGVAGVAGCDAVFQSIDGGKTFAAISVDPGLLATATEAVTSLAISPDYDKANNSGELAVGLFTGNATPSVKKLKPAAVFVVTTFAEGTANNSTLAVCYSQNKDDYTLGRVFVVAGATGGQTLVVGAWATAGLPDLLDAVVATSASCAWPEATSGPGGGAGWYAGFATAAGAGNLFKRSSSSWDAKSPCAPLPAACPIAGVAARGFGSDANVLASQFGVAVGTTNVYRSTNGGSSWSAKNVDSTDAIAGLTGGKMMLAAHPQMVSNGIGYVSLPGPTGAVMKTSNKGASWADTGLSNAHVAGVGLGAAAASVANDSTWFIRMANGTTFEWYKTSGMGDSSPYQRVVRSTGSGFDFTELDRSPAFNTDGIAYLTRRGEGSDRMIKSTDAGLTWKAITTNPIDTEEIQTVQAASASQIYLGTDEGHILWTTDGGSSWTQSNTDVGNKVLDIDLSTDFATDNTLFVTAVSTSNTYEVWRSTDGGTTFTQLGSSTGAWGSGTAAVLSAAITLSPLYKTDKMAFFRVRGANDNDIWRLKTDGTGNWEPVGTGSGDQEFGDVSLFAAPGIGDGIVLYATANVDDAAGAQFVLRTFNPLTVTKNNFTDSKLVSRNTFGDGTVNTGLNQYTLIRTHTTGRQWYRFIAAAGAGRIANLLETKEFLAPVATNSPLNNSNVPTNTGDNGVPLTLTWQNVDRVRNWDVQMALDPDFKQLLVDPTTTAGLCGPGGPNGCMTNPSATVSAAALVSSTVISTSLVQGNTYYWRIRARAVGSSITTAAVHPGPWTSTRKFSVAPPAGSVSTPQPSLPLNGSQLPGVGTTLSWNNPAGSTQIQIQVTPLNNDGPAINLIFGSPIQSYDVPAPVFGTGPYVMLPGATYTWRLRASNAVTAIGEGDSSWGPWSDPRTFSAAPPNAGTIQLVEPINGKAITDTTPTLSWKDGNPAMFYYEIQMSSDKNFGEAGIVASVFWNLIHGGVATPNNTWTVPDAFAVAKGTYFWRIRQRVQATPKGGTETGIPWSPIQTFVVG